MLKSERQLNGDGKQDQCFALIFKVKNTLLKHTDGKGNCLVFFKLTKEGVSLLYYP